MRFRTRIRLAACCLLLVGLAFIQDPGYLVSDTKFDLAVAPGQFLVGALHLWDPLGAFGQLQNQAYGYLWPMGPFFLVLHGLDVPGWIVQRLWQALVLCVAFLGAARVSRALGVRSDAAAIVAGLAFALSPRMLTVLGPSSIEVWPMALAPWVLLPLITGSRTGSPRRAAALSALGVAMVGGVNAAATFAVLPLGVVWLLTRERGPRRRSLMIWWPTFTLLGTLWWLVPLLVMGSYSPPFLDFIETTTVTTFPTTVFDALRGTSNWIPYVSADSRAGNDLLIYGFLALNSGILLVAGFAGILDRRNPHRLFLALSVALGLLMVTAGHVGPVHGPFAEQVRVLLDGVLAPLRNVHKFDLIIRLPLVLGLAFVVDRVLRARAEATEPAGDLKGQLDRFNRLTMTGMVLVGLMGACIPALVGRIEPASPVTNVPDYWQEAADWLDEREGEGTALLAPGSGFGSYLWGAPKDEPFQWLSEAPWAVRNVIPLAPTGNIRMLDAVEDRFAQGQGSPGLASYLRRNGVGFLVVRNDLRPTNDVPDPVVVHQTIEDSPGLRRVASFGPEVGGGAHLTKGSIRTVVNGGWQAVYPAIEVFRVEGGSAATSGSAPTVVVGGPEDLLGLEDLDAIDPGPTVLAPDVDTDEVDPAATSFVLTDGLRERERFYARIHDGYSAVRTPGEEPRKLNPHPDYLTADEQRWLTTVRLDGARAVSASSSGADSDAAGGTRRGELAYAAVDGSPQTEWVSNPVRDGRTWWQLDLTDAREVSEVEVTGGAQADENQDFRVRTENGVSEEAVAGPGETATVEVPAGSTRWIRVESPDTGNRLMSLAEVDVDGVRVTRRLVLPSTPESWGNPRTIALRADQDARRGCIRVDGAVRCAEGKQRASEEAVAMPRRFTLADDGSYTPTLMVRPRGGTALDELVTRQQPVNISASSTGTPDPRSSPVAAIDGDPATTWIADVGDFRPTLNLNWIGRRDITGLRMTVSRDTAARRPKTVVLVWPGGRREVELDSDGRATFPAIRTSQLRIQVREATFVTSLGFDSRSTQAGVGIQELRLTGQPSIPLTLSTLRADTGCGSGPEVEVNGSTYRTAVTTTPAALFSGEQLPARICVPPGTEGDVAFDLDAGANDVTVRGSDAFDVMSLLLRDDGAPPATGDTQAAGSRAGSPVDVLLRPGSGDDVVNLGGNENRGWEATQDGRRLEPVVLNGWQQGWWLRGDGPVQASYAPDVPYRLGLGAGLLTLLALVGYVLAGTLRRREDDAGPPALGAAAVGPVTAHVVALGAAVLLAGWPGALVAAVTAGLVHALRRWVPEAVGWVLGGCCLVAAGGYFLHPWTDPTGWAGDTAWPHYLALVSVLGALLVAADERRPRSFRRMQGASTKR